MESLDLIITSDTALAHLQANGGQGQGRVVAVVDGDLQGGGALHVGADGDRDAELLLVDGAAGLRGVNAEDGRGDGLGLRIGIGVGAGGLLWAFGWGGPGLGGDLHGAAEAAFEGLGQDE